MPVAVLVCEGGPQSPDVRTLSKILAGLCEVRPFGSKYGMGDRIKGMRQHLGPVVFGILDGDFQDLDQPAAGRPRDWIVEGQVFGWRWERKEIENYLLDPDVVSHALGMAAPPHATYEQLLDSARRRIAIYEAARTCLGLLQKQYRPLATSFGRPRGADNHKFPDALDEPSCRTELERTLREHESSLASGSQRFESLLGECSPNGSRFAGFLSYFAGKDLMWAIDQPLRQLGFNGCGVLRERILLGIEATLDSAETWLPEWRALREAVTNA